MYLTFLIFQTHTCFSYFFKINLLFLNTLRIEHRIVISKILSYQWKFMWIGRLDFWRIQVIPFFHQGFHLDTKRNSIRFYRKYFYMHLQDQENQQLHHFSRLFPDFQEYSVVYHQFQANELKKKTTTFTSFLQTGEISLLRIEISKGSFGKGDATTWSSCTSWSSI